MSQKTQDGNGLWGRPEGDHPRSLIERIERLEEAVAAVCRHLEQQQNALFDRHWAAAVRDAPQLTEQLRGIARRAGRQDGLHNCRDNAGRWPSGAIGHEDYERGWEDGHTSLTDLIAETAP